MKTTKHNWNKPAPNCICSDNCRMEID